MSKGKEIAAWAWNELNHDDGFFATDKLAIHIDAAIEAARVPVTEQTDECADCNGQGWLIDTRDGVTPEQYQCGSCYGEGIKPKRESIAQFDSISVDVSTGEHDAGLRAFAEMPPLEIMENKGKKVALFQGHLNESVKSSVPMREISIEQAIHLAANAISTSPFSKWAGKERSGRQIFRDGLLALEKLGFKITQIEGEKP